MGGLFSSQDKGLTSTAKAEIRDPGLLGWLHRARDPLGYSAIFNMRIHHHGLRRLLLTRPGRKKEEAEDISGLFDGTTRKLHMSLTITSHWPEFSHMAMNSCKGDWEM